MNEQAKRIELASQNFSKVDTLRYIYKRRALVNPVYDSHYNALIKRTEKAEKDFAEALCGHLNNPQSVAEYTPMMRFLRFLRIQ